MHTGFGTHDEVQDEPVFIFNLDHDILVKYRDDLSCTIESFGQDTAPLRLTRDQQLLLLDALCRQYSFPSPLAGVVRSQEVGEAPGDEADEPYTITPIEDLPPLPEDPA